MTRYAVRHLLQGIVRVETGRHGLTRRRAKLLARRLGGTVVRLHRDP